MIIHKTAVSKDGIEYILSDDTLDRYGDVVEPAGWDLKNFKKNPIALFGHSGSFPVGTWENIRVQGNKLVARLKLAAKGTSDRLDEIISLVEQGVLRAVSVGFAPIESEPMDADKPYGGRRYLKQELLETSLVSVGANPSALQIAKELKISDETMTLVFGKDAKDGRGSGSRPTGENASSTSRTGNIKMPTLAERITETQTRLVNLQDELRKHLEELPDDPNEQQNATTASLNEKIGDIQETLGNLVEAEKQLTNTVTRAAPTGASITDTRKPFAVPAKKIEPVDYMFRAMTVELLAHVQKRPHVDILREHYGDQQEGQITKAITDIMIEKAAVAPADTATAAWAGVLVQTAIQGFTELLLPQSVYPGLSARGIRVDFGRNGTVSIPTRDATPTVAGSFVGEGAPIPVRRAGFSAVTMTPKKMAVITTMTREITERSTPAIEQLLRNAIQEDTAVSIDSILLDNGAATTIRPAGIRNGITTAAGTAGGGFAAVVADVKGMLGSLVTATNGNLRDPVWLMNPAQAIALSLTQNAGGDFPWKQEINGNSFQGYPVIQSATVPAGVVILLDAADFATATGDDPRFDVSDQATLHMEDTTPLAIGTSGAPNTVAAPTRSLFQTDSLALRMLLPMNWVFRRTGVAVERTAVTW